MLRVDSPSLCSLPKIHTGRTGKTPQRRVWSEDQDEDERPPGLVLAAVVVTSGRCPLPFLLVRVKLGAKAFLSLLPLGAEGAVCRDVQMLGGQGYDLAACWPLQPASLLYPARLGTRTAVVPLRRAAHTH